MSFQVVNGYVCFNCSDVALAKKGDNPAHPPGTPSNPTGQTPNGTNAAGGPNQASGVSQPNSTSATNGPAVVFGGSLAQPVSSVGASPSANASPQPTYQTGSQLSLSA